MPANYTTIDGDILEQICNRHYNNLPGALEAVLEANRGLAKLGPVLPAGITIQLPELAPPTNEDTYTLW